MATRINTKFVITLSLVLVLLVLGALFAFMFLKKTAADHVKLADAAMVRADDAIAQGDVKIHNSECKRAAKHYGAAKSKDANNVAYLYGYVKAQDQLICDNLTQAMNLMGSIREGAAGIHDTPSATEQDRAVLYELLHKRTRMTLFNSRMNPISAMINDTTRRLDIDPQDPVAQKYHAMAVSYLPRQRTDEAEIEKDLETLNTAAQASPDNPWLQSALARYHEGNAQRILRASGNAVTDEVNASFALALQHVEKAIELSQDNPPAYVEAASLLTALRSGDEASMNAITALKNRTVTAMDQMLVEKDNRDALLIEELGLAVGMIQRERRPAEHADGGFDGPDKALALAQATVEDRPDSPTAYRTLGNLQRELNFLTEAEKTIQTGLATDRLANANMFIRDGKARLQMRSLQAEIKTVLALRSKDEAPREALLQEVEDIIDVMADADTMETDWRDARVAFLRGRIALVQNNPRLAVELLEKANKAYNNGDPQTLRLLAQTHAQLGNDALVAGFYETIINNNLRPIPQDFIRLIQRYLTAGEGQQLDKAEQQLTWYRKQVPSDIRGVRLQAQLLQARGKTDEAIALLQEQDLEKHPELLDQISVLQLEQGDTEGAIKMLRQRIAAQGPAQSINMRLVTELLNLIPDEAGKQAELERLIEQGLDKEFAAVLKRVLTTGRPTVEDQIALVDVQDYSPGRAAINKFLVYQQNNQPEAARPFLDQAIKEEPNLPLVIEWRFKFALSEKRWPDAQQALKDMLELSPKERPALAVADGQFMRAQILAVKAGTAESAEARNKLVREAIIAYNKALDEYNHNVDGWIQLGRLHLVQSNFFAAQDSLQEALSRQSRNVQALELMARAQLGGGDVVNALERFEQVLAIQPGHPTALNDFTALALQTDNIARAIALREQVRDRVPANYDNQRILAQLYAENEAYNEARKAIQAVIDAEGRTRQNIATLSQILSMDGVNAEATQLVQKYVAELGDEAQWQDHLVLAQAYERAEQPEQADRSYAKAIQVEKAEGTFTSSLALAQAMISRGEAEKAAELFGRLTQEFPENSALKLQAADLYLRIQQFDRAGAIIDDLPASVQRYRLLIRSASTQPGRLGEALKHAREAVDAYPDDSLLQITLLELLRTEQDTRTPGDRDYGKVLAMAKELASEHPDKVDVKIVLADVLARMNQAGQAASHLESALKLAPKHLAANERMFSLRLQEARSLVQANPDVSRQKASEALAIAPLLIEGRPDDAAVLRSAGQAATLAGQTAKAGDYFEQTLALTQSETDLLVYATTLLEVGRGADAQATLESSEHATLLSNSLGLRALRGRAIAAAGRPDVASTLFNNLLSRADALKDQELITGQVIQTFSSEPMRAVEVVEKAMGQDLPVSIELALSSRLMTSGQYEEASKRLVKYADQPIEDLPTRFFLLTQLALSQQESGQYLQAKATYERVHAMMTENKKLIPPGRQVLLLNNMAYLMADQMEGVADQAVGYAKQAMGLLPKNVTGQQYALISDTYGWALFKAGRTQEAIDVLKESVEKLPLVDNQLHLGRAYLAAGDKDRALLILEAAVNQAKAEKNEKMIAETQKWYREAL